MTTTNDSKTDNARAWPDVRHVYVDPIYGITLYALWITGEDGEGELVPGTDCGSWEEAEALCFASGWDERGARVSAYSISPTKLVNRYLALARGEAK